MYFHVNKPLSAEQWASFSPKAQWDCIVALRGPDALVHQDGIKWLTSAVIRGRLREVMRVGGMVNVDLPAVVVPASSSAFMWNARHFFDHVQEAARYLQIPTVMVPAGLYLEVAGGTTSHPLPSIRHLVEQFKSSPDGPLDILVAWLLERDPTFAPPPKPPKKASSWGAYALPKAPPKGAVVSLSEEE